MSNLKLKVCGLTQAANVAAVAQLHPNYMGFIFYEKSPRYISEISAELIPYVPNGIKTVGVFVNEEIDKVKEHIMKYQLKAVQLHGNESPNYCAELRQFNIEIIKAFGISETFDFTILSPYDAVVDYFLFDTQSKKHGGSGKTFDWNLLANYPLDKSYFLSGGIGPEHINFIKNISDERLYAIDVNSRFEVQPGLKNVDELEEFFEKLEKD
jgi:phosphoribosylanthranilate isomerase